MRVLARRARGQDRVGRNRRVAWAAATATTRHFDRGSSALLTGGGRLLPVKKWLRAVQIRATRSKNGRARSRSGRARSRTLGPRSRRPGPRSRAAEPRSRTAEPRSRTAKTGHGTPWPRHGRPKSVTDLPSPVTDARSRLRATGTRTPVTGHGSLERRTTARRHEPRATNHLEEWRRCAVIHPDDPRRLGPRGSS